MTSSAHIGPGSLGWKTFRFFDETPHVGASLPDGVTATATDDSNNVWLGTASGLVVCLDASVAPSATFPAFRGKIHCLAISNGKLVGLGEEADGIKTLTLKAWDLAGLQSGVTPPPLASSKIFASTKLPEGMVQAAAVCVQEWPIANVVLGTSTGAVHIFRGDAVKSKITAPNGRFVLRSSSSTTAQPSGINQVHFAGARGPARHVFVVSSTSTAALSVATGQQLMLDDCGAAAGCSAVTSNNELVLAGVDAIYFYTAEEGRKAAVAVRGEKRALATYRHYVAVVLPGESNTSASSTLRVYDVAHKVIGASATLQESVDWLVTDAHGVTVADTSGSILRFIERPLEARLEALFRVRAFQLALKVAEAEKAPAKMLADVYRHFGDYLYSKRDYDGATMQYISTIGWLEPSHVIQRFLEPQRAANLTSYLEILHEQRLASADHTTILLTCYAKLKNVAAIESFLRRAGGGGGSGEKSDAAAPRFRLDAPAAVAALRSSGLPDMALSAAEVSGDAELRLEVLLRDCGRAADGLTFVKTLGRRRAAHALQRHGKSLLDAEPVGTTALLMELSLPSNTPPAPAQGSNVDQQNDNDGDANFVANFADFTHLYADRPDDLRYACVTILAMGESVMDPVSRQALYHTLLDLYLGANSNNGNGGGGGSGNSSPTAASAAPSASATQSLSSLPGNGNQNGGSRAEALDLLHRGWQPGQDAAYDVGRALTACRLHSFAAGLVFLYTNLRMYREAAAVLADSADWNGLLELCELHGNAAQGGDPEIWRDALRRLSSVAAGPSAAAPLRELLSRIEASDVLPPLAVLPVLARNPHLKLELVKEYVTRALEVENRGIAEDNEEVDRLKSEIEEAEATVKRLSTEPVVFQASRDSQTGAPLELPSVHFMCGHSFNLRTLGDASGSEGVDSGGSGSGGGAECPLCAPELKQLQELQRSHRAAATDRDTFFKQLRAAPDGFSLVAEYFGKGMLAHTSVTSKE